MVDWTWIVAAIALLGAWFNARGKTRSFIMWLCTNTVWMVVDFNEGLYAQSAQFAAFAALSVYGIYQWRKDGYKW